MNAFAAFLIAAVWWLAWFVVLFSLVLLPLNGVVYLFAATSLLLPVTVVLLVAWALVSAILATRAFGWLAGSRKHWHGPSLEERRR